MCKLQHVHRTFGWRKLTVLTSSLLVLFVMQVGETPESDNAGCLKNLQNSLELNSSKLVSMNFLNLVSSSFNLVIETISVDNFFLFSRQSSLRFHLCQSHWVRVSVVPGPGQGGSAGVRIRTLRRALPGCSE